MSLLTDVDHVIIGGGRNLVCHWPRQGGIWRWGNELLVGYIESPCDYADPKEVRHGQEGIWNRGYLRLRRSLDGGVNWADAGKVFDNSLPVEEQRRILRLDDYHEHASPALDDYHVHAGPARESIDMVSPDAILIMGRAWCGDESKAEAADGTAVRDNVSYCFRSPDRGGRWETVPSILWPDHGTRQGQLF